jgi:hypothetical protein
MAWWAFFVQISITTTFIGISWLVMYLNTRLFTTVDADLHGQMI